MKQCKLFMPFNEWEQVHEEIKKRQHSHICIMNENTFAISSFALASFCLLVFLFCLHLSSKKFRNYYMHCEIIDCYSTYFCWSITEKRELKKCFLGTSAWELKPVYWSPKWPGYVTDWPVYYWNISFAFQ